MNTRWILVVLACVSSGCATGSVSSANSSAACALQDEEPTYAFAGFLFVGPVDELEKVQRYAQKVGLTLSMDREAEAHPTLLLSPASVQGNIEAALDLVNKCQRGVFGQVRAGFIGG